MWLRPHVNPTAALVRLMDAINAHDLDALAACFEPDYRSDCPAHPSRSFRGRAQMRENWSRMFALLPDLEAALLGCVALGDTVWAEWEWRGTRPDGARRVMRGVTVQGVRRDRIAWVRLYMEPVQDGDGGGLDAASRQPVSATAAVSPQHLDAGDMGPRGEGWARPRRADVSPPAS